MSEYFGIAAVGFKLTDKWNLNFVCHTFASVGAAVGFNHCFVCRQVYHNSNHADCNVLSETCRESAWLQSCLRLPNTEAMRIFTASAIDAFQSIVTKSSYLSLLTT